MLILPTAGKIFLETDFIVDGKIDTGLFFPAKLNLKQIGEQDRPLAQLQSARYRCGRSGVRFLGRSNRHSVANDSPPLRRFFGAVLPRR